MKYLVGRITFEAQREGVSLSEIEVQMLYFSETDWSLPDIASVSEVFDREYDQSEYEQKISALILNYLAYARKNEREDLIRWKDAIRKLRGEDHYLQAIIAFPEGPGDKSPDRFLKLFAIGFVLACVVLGLGYLFLYLRDAS